MNRLLTAVSLPELVEALAIRMRRLEQAGARVRSVGRLRELVQRAYNAGEMTGAAERLDAVALRLSQVLDEATAKATDEPEPGASDAHKARLAAAREDRRSLWQAIETMRGECKAEADRLRIDAHKRHMQVASLTDEALRPEEPLRQRAGRWLHALGVRISERGAT